MPKLIDFLICSLRCSDQSLASSETRKKKERRKDKENAALESSEDEALDSQGNLIFYIQFWSDNVYS